MAPKATQSRCPEQNHYPCRLGREPKRSWAAVRDNVQPQSFLTADEHGSYDDLVGLAILRRVNRSKAYQTGTDTNPIESFCARAERWYVGIHHRFSLKCLDWYMAMVAWKEGTLYMGLRWQVPDVLRTVTHRTPLLAFQDRRLRPNRLKPCFQFSQLAFQFLDDRHHTNQLHRQS